MKVTSTPLLQARELSVSTESSRIVESISFSLCGGEAVLLLGPNGAGKSTLLAALAGVSSHEVTGSRTYTGTISLVSQKNFLYEDFTVEENLALTAGILKIGKSALSILIESWQIQKLLSKIVRELSQGQRQTVSLVRALIASPDILLLDEPTSALDDRATELFLDRMQSFVSTNRLVLIASHDLLRIQTLATRALLMQQGRIVCDVPKIDDSLRTTYHEVIR